ncbi:MAG: BrnA antitoxin family protein [Patescibacteria group bacterium]
MKKKIELPKFKNESEERNFWEKFDLSEYAEKGDFRKVAFPDLKPTSKSISIRIPTYILLKLKEEANSKDIPYQSLIKEFIVNGLG